MSSEYMTILESVQARVKGVAGTVPVLIRRRPVMLSTDSLPLIVVAPSADGETIGMETFSAGVTWEYPVIVAIYSAGNRELEINTNDFTLREAVRDVLYQPLLTGASTVYDLEMSMSGPFNLRSQENTVETDAFKVIYKSSETRVA